MGRMRYYGFNFLVIFIKNIKIPMEYSYEDKPSLLHKNYSSVDSLDEYNQKDDIDVIITEYIYMNSARGKCMTLMEKVFCCSKR